MGKNHLLNLNAPKSWKFNRKETKFVARPIPGPHSMDKSLTLTFILRELLKQAKTTKEIKMILTNGEVLVDKKKRTEVKYPVGLMDVLEIPKLEEHYRMILKTDGTLTLISIDNKEADIKLLKVINKTIVKKGKFQITFHDGRNILLDKSECKIGDSALFNIKDNKISKWIPLTKESLVYLSAGGHVGSLGKIVDILKTRDLQKPKVIVEINGKNYITLMSYSFVVGKDKPEISLGEKK